jgi:glucose-1-phosphate thymidylyltransferase
MNLITQDDFMKIIIPMAGRGTRLRPHTLTVPKPLLPIAGKPIVQRLVEDIVRVCNEPVEEIAFIIGDFGDQVEKDLLDIAQKVGSVGKIYYQDKPLGTAHALLCAKPSLTGNLVIAFADTLFKADFTLDKNHEGVIWVQQVPNPSAYGVIKTNADGYITDFIEKPTEFVSDLAIIGIYYVKNGDALRDEMQYLIDHDLKEKGEYQLTNALETLKRKGVQFAPARITEWLDCGNKEMTVNTNQRYLEYIKDTQLVAESAQVVNSVIIPPVYLGQNVQVHNSVIGPHVSVGDNTTVKNSVIKNTIVQQQSHIDSANLQNSMIGSHAKVHGTAKDLSIGDYCEVKL